MKRLLLAMLLGLMSLNAPAEAPMPCTGPEYQQFDFWVGEWDVVRPDGTMAGSNRIEKEYNGCVLHERYSTPKGYSGESLNAYDAGRKVWHQTWVDNTGLLLLLEGRRVGKSMILEGATSGPDGKTTKHRITWTPNPDGTVRQLWEAEASGKWAIAFDGLYQRRASK